MPKIPLHFPYFGLDQRMAHSSQPQMTSIDCENIYSDGSREKRLRGGCRAGRDRFYVLSLGSEIRTLVTTRTLEGQFLGFWEDDFITPPYNLDPIWDQTLDGIPPGYNFLNKIVPFHAGINYPHVTDPVAMSRPAPPDLDIAQAQVWTVRISSISPPPYPHFNLDFSFGIDDDDFDDSVNNSIKVRIQIVPNSLSTNVSIYKYESGAIVWQEDSGDVSWYEAYPFLNMNIIYDPTYNGGQGRILVTSPASDYDLVQRIGNIGTLAGTRIGVSPFNDAGDIAGSRASISYFSWQWAPVQQQDNETNRVLLVASTVNKELWAENDQHVMELVSTPTTLGTDKAHIHGVEHRRKLYFADYGLVIFGSGSIASDGVTLTAPGSFTEVNVNDHMVYVEGPAANQTGSYGIDSVLVDGVVLSSSTGGLGSVNFRIERSLKVFDPVAQTLKLLQPSVLGFPVPFGCPLIALYRDRLVSAGWQGAPHQWFMSAQGDPADHDYSQPATIAGRAVAGISTDAGQLPAPITALIPHSDDYLIFACAYQMWILRGDPTFGGTLDNLSYKVGVADKMAWCKGPDGTLYFVSRDGIYSMPPGALGYPRSISRDRLPQLLFDDHTDTYPQGRAIRMEYHTRLRVIQLSVYNFLNPEASGKHYWINPRQQHPDNAARAFFPMSYSSVQKTPSAMVYYESEDPGRSDLIMGDRDGYLRKYQPLTSTEEGDPVPSHVLLGPVYLGKDKSAEGMLVELSAMLGEGFGSLSYEVYVGTSEREAWQSNPVASGSLGKTFNYKKKIRRRGNVAFVKLLSDGTAPWEFEKMFAGTLPTGNVRKFSRIDG